MLTEFNHPLHGLSCGSRFAWASFTQKRYILFILLLSQDIIGVLLTMEDERKSNGRVKRRSLLAAGGLTAVGALAGCAGAQRGPLAATNSNQMQADEPEREVVVRQEPGNTFYWVKPGPRRLSPHVFGTPENPRFGTDLLQARIEEAKGLPEPLGNAIPQLLEDLPPLVAAPEAAREPIDDEDAIAHEVFTEPTLYSNEAEVTDGAFEVRYQDNQPYDTGGPPGRTQDTAELDAQFTDPAGNEYELELDHVVKPPLPGYETGGGVFLDAWHHGTTGTGSPLMPKVYAYGAFWGVVDVIVNGEVATEEGFRVMHFMTTQTIRDSRYRLALDEHLPLATEDTIAGQLHHTHGVVLPIRPTDEGPVFDPVPTALELPNGQTQPFIHAMWEQDELVEAPFSEWPPQTAAGGDGSDDSGPDADFRLGANAQAWQGQAPGDLEGQDNPPLTLEAETEYTLVWENLDGIQHNFAIEDTDGEDVLATDLVREAGTTQTVEFTASSEMAEYYCQVHPTTMRGPIEVR